jgi:FKBP-type peptidyl-prolyl cis-trans isomerase FklB
VKPFCLIVSIALLLAGGLAAQETTVDKPAGLVNRASYGIGINLGRQWVAQEVPINLDLVIQGMRDGMAGSTALMSDEEIGTAFQEMRQKLTAELAERNRQEGAAFLEANGARAGVNTLPSGLQYEVLTEGDGPMPQASDSVTVHYRGTLIDGTVFDSSYDRGEAASFGVGGVIQGWQEALQLMKVGSKWKLFIPSELAYGQNPPGPTIPPNATLLFEVELLSVEGSE